jgi:phospholipase/carboxylesterase
MPDLINATVELPLDHRVMPVGHATPQGPVLILLHGMGSNEGGMLKLSEILPDGGLIYALRAPYVMSPGKYTWYEADLSGGTPTIRFDEAEKSRALIHTFIRGVRHRHGLGGEKVIVGGFSQGGVMSYNLGLTSPDLIKAIFILGSRLQPQIRPLIKPVQELKDLSIFIGHGTEDRVLALAHAHEAAGYLRGIGLAPELHEYALGHTIGPEMISDLKDWIAGLDT